MRLDEACEVDIILDTKMTTLVAVHDDESRRCAAAVTATLRAMSIVRTSDAPIATQHLAAKHRRIAADLGAQRRRRHRQRHASTRRTNAWVVASAVRAGRRRRFAELRPSASSSATAWIIAERMTHRSTTATIRPIDGGPRDRRRVIDDWNASPTRAHAAAVSVPLRAPPAAHPPRPASVAYREASSPGEQKRYCIRGPPDDVATPSAQLEPRARTRLDTQQAGGGSPA